MEFLHSVFRITKGAYANDLSGLGAFKVGGRWNSKGGYMLYTASSVSLAILENLAHFNLHYSPTDMKIVKITIPSDSFRLIERSELQTEWKSLPFNKYTQKIGDSWLSKQDSLVLVVPSVVNPLEYNYLINPHHPKFKNVKIEDITPFDFDERLG